MFWRAAGGEKSGQSHSSPEGQCASERASLRLPVLPSLDRGAQLGFYGIYESAFNLS
jgi:hypothetical protein